MDSSIFLEKISTLDPSLNSLKKREREQKASFILLNKILPNEEIVHDPTGKPHLLNKEFNISISHSADFICIQLKEKTFLCGIDIETKKEKALKIACKFMTSDEMLYLKTLPNKNSKEIFSALVWSAKESCYKALPNPSSNFKKDYETIFPIINPPTKTPNTLQIYYKNPKDSYSFTFDLGCKITSDYILTWVKDCKKH